MVVDTFRFDNGQTVEHHRQGHLGAHFWYKGEGRYFVQFGLFHNSLFTLSKTKPSRSFSSEQTARRAMARWLDAGR